MDSEERFEELFRSTFRRVMAYCLRRTSPASAPDAVAEVYAVAWRRRKHLPGGEDDATLWLLAIARRVLANQARGRWRWSRLVRRVAEHDPPRQDVPGPEADDGEELNAALARLSPTDQEVLRLAYWDELVHRDIATVLGISEGAVTTRLHRARERLRGHLSELETNRIPMTKGGL